MDDSNVNFADITFVPINESFYRDSPKGNELNNDYDLQELKNTLKEEGETEIQLIIKDKNKKLSFKLEKPRKFDLSIFNNVKNKQYVKKISF